jgi:protein TonB
MTDLRFWIALVLALALHALGLGGLAFGWMLLHEPAEQSRTPPVLIQAYGDSDTEGMNVATVSTMPGGITEDTPPAAPVVPEPVARPVESEEPPPVPETKVPAPEAKPTTEPKVGVAAPGQASTTPGKPSAGGKLGVKTGVRQFGKAAMLTYPAEAIPYKLDAEIVLKLTVTPEGKVKSVTLHQKSGYAILDDSAVREARSLRFVPATEDGVAVESTFYAPYHYVYPGK